MKHAICKGCGKNFIRSEGFKKYCSGDCKIQFPKSKCFKGCQPENLFIREVEFKNKTLHKQQVCKVCRKTSYVPRETEIGFSPEAKIQDAIESQSKHRKAKYGDNFYSSKEWLWLRYLAFTKYGKICALCESTKGPLQVDHIKPRFKYPLLALNLDNLQILCRECNLGKGAWDETDWREENEIPTH